MEILGLHEDTNSNLVYLQDGKILFAAAEERFTRNKFQQGFPRHCVAYLKQALGKDLSTADVVAVGNPYHFLSRIPGVLPDAEHDFFGPAQKLYLTFQENLSKSRVLSGSALALSQVMFRLRYKRSPTFTDHHTAHAYSAYMTSGFPEAVTISADNMGDGFAAKVFDCVGGACSELYGSTALRSPGQFYGEITQLLGFHCLMAGKVTGLAAYGDWRPAYSLVSRLFSLSPDGTDFEVNPLWLRNRRKGAYAELSRFSPAEIAAATQRRFEDVMVTYVRNAVVATGRRKVALAGGVFANVKLNQRIMELPEIEEVFIHPAMSDQGIALGAALHYLAENVRPRPEPFRLQHVFFGPDFSHEEMGRVLEEGGRRGELRYTRPRDMEATVAKLLVEGKVVARYHGAMEYGPRALGHRSILCRPDAPGVNNWLNRQLNRSEFMPFAPVTLDEHAADCYKQIEKGRYTAQFMTICFNCTDAMKRSSAGVVHVDGTARPQLITEEVDPQYYRIVKLFYEKTGIPSLINTSFNMHSEPIVCTPGDAVRAFVDATLDYLVMGPFLAVRSKTWAKRK